MKSDTSINRALMRELTTDRSSPLAESVSAMTEPACQPSALGLATCSPAVPVCELEMLAESWLHRHAKTLEPTHNLLYCRDELRRLIEAAKERQPQENSPRMSHGYGRAN